MPLNPAFAATFAPPVMEARRWLTETPLPEGLPLLNLSQAAPVDPPPAPLRAAMARAIEQDPSIHLYSPVLGNPALRARLAARIAALYGGTVGADQVALTSGCNQAFCAAVAVLAAAGDQVILPVPWYFNHAMWLSLSGIEAVPLPTGADLLPDPDQAAALITPRTRAIALVTPNNPGGVEYPPALLEAFAALAARHKIALIVDETYRDFHTRDGAPHTLFTNPDWDETLIHLYSFSKAYRLTGHRVGAIAAAPARLAEIEKFLDTVTICVSGPGQMAALWGLENLEDWLAGERLEILRRRAAMIAGFQRLDGWELLGCGAYFAYARHPFDAPSPQVARRLLAEAGVLMLPGTMFRPQGDPAGAREMRIAFANADTTEIGDLMTRLGRVGQAVTS
ncbi:MAG: aminotransferase [Rhodobacter sp.]|uniref:aminotransferase n=1 Tax=Pararhodobacter sp. TaxID=2127056 RepID=UPI002D14A22D|nr:aminotransferase [Pararhodobacter sp.]MCC0074287.1 aminotransferase [Rhodobacter sp.]HPD92799.1 aminotransferase [Pararhodobacter sp.]